MASATTSSSFGRRGRLARCAGVLVISALATAHHAPTAAAATTAPQTDPPDAQGPLDLAKVALVQIDVRLSMRIATRGAWTSAQLTESPGRAVCITLVHGDPAIARGRVCVTRRARSAALSYTPLAADGSALATRRLAATVSRPRRRVLEAAFLPAAAGLSVGRYAWFADTAWTSPDDCPSTCGDRLPDAGAVPARLRLLGFPSCFGAAARDPGRPCRNPKLRLTLEPTLTRSQAIPDPFCDTRERVKLLSSCAFGAAKHDADRTFALIGDSHAANMKAALEVVSLGKRWRGISLLRAGCPATRATPILDTPQRSQQCARWNRYVLAWLARHREVDTVFLAAHSGARVAGGASPQAGYSGAISAMLRLGRRVVVIRDTPFSASGHLRCVAGALKARRSPGPACARPRGVALRPDPLAAVAAAMSSPRVRLIDLTRHFCDAQRCFPVVGGALVHRDESHLTAAFSASLGPYILRALGG